jgi:hypothetical protein
MAKLLKDLAHGIFLATFIALDFPIILDGQFIS